MDVRFDWPACFCCSFFSVKQVGISLRCKLYFSGHRCNSEILLPEMGLLTILKKQRLKEKELRILVLGLDNSGKTTVVKKLNGEEIDEIAPTFGFNIKTLEYKDMKLNMWDVGGQKSLRSYWRNYFEQTDGVIWVVDSADIDRMDDCKRELGHYWYDIMPFISFYE
uniref:ADP-ribosylation factor-like protein 2 n=1 Tax=Loa loa TaxID=7209 RepID=A0A1I7W2J5_LOALO